MARRRSRKMSQEFAIIYIIAFIVLLKIAKEMFNSIFLVLNHINFTIITITLLTILLIFYIYKTYKKSLTHHLITKSTPKYEKVAIFKSIEQVRNMNPYEFEHVVANWLEKCCSFKSIRVTKSSGDDGFDIYCKDKYGEKYLVEVKRQGRAKYEHLTYLKDRMNDYGVSKGMYVVTGVASQRVIEYALRNNIELVDAKGINEWIKLEKTPV